jgi:hypothetical protein
VVTTGVSLTMSSFALTSYNNPIVPPAIPTARVCIQACALQATPIYHHYAAAPCASQSARAGPVTQLLHCIHAASGPERCMPVPALDRADRELSCHPFFPKSILVSTRRFTLVASSSTGYDYAYDKV